MAASVVCNQLGYASGGSWFYAKTLVEPSESEREALPIAMGGVLCTKNQVYRSLLECELKREASTCGHNKDIGLECLGTRMPPVPQLAAGATRHEVHLEPNMMQRLDGLKEFDQLRFWWTAASGSGIYRLASEEAFVSCNFDQAELIFEAPGHAYMLSKDVYWEGTMYFAYGNSTFCGKGMKFAASSAQYSTYANFSWPVNEPGGCVVQFFADDKCANPLHAIRSLGDTLDIRTPQAVRAIMFVGASCYASVWGTGTMAGPSYDLRPGGYPYSGSTSKAPASVLQGCDSFPFVNTSALSLNMLKGNRVQSARPRLAYPDWRPFLPWGNARCTCPDGQSYDVTTKCSSGGRGLKRFETWNNQFPGCDFGSEENARGEGSCTTESQPLSVTCAYPPAEDASFQHACGLGDVKLPVNGGHPMVYYNGVWAPICNRYFQKSHFGPSLICRKLGYDGGFGKVISVSYRVPVDHVATGDCYEHDEDVLSGHTSGNARIYTNKCSMDRPNPEGSIVIQCAGTGGRQASCNESLVAPDRYYPPPNAVSKNCTDGDVLLASQTFRVESLLVPSNGVLALPDPLVTGEVVSVADKQELVTLDQPIGAAYLFLDGNWQPISTEHFFANHEGAITFCKKLGFERGIVGKNVNFLPPVPELQLGQCRQGEDLLNCTGGENSRFFIEQGRFATWVICDDPHGHAGVFSTCNWNVTSGGPRWPPPPPPENVFPELDVETHTAQFPAAILQCNAGTRVSQTSCSTLQPRAYERIVERMVEMYESLPARCDTSVCPQGDLAGCILRLAGHDLMDFANSTGGSNGCLDFNDTDNKGLFPCLAGRGEFSMGKTLESVYSDFCGEVSLADFIVIAAEAIMMRTRPDWLGPSLNRSYALDLSNGFRFGRTTAETCTPPALPNAEDGCDAVKANFIDSLGLTWKESAALMGVHTLGRARKAFSGYEGWWNEGPEGRAFNNSYYISLLAKGWEPRNVGPNKNLWIRSDSGSNAEIMLSSDLCLLYETGKKPSNARDALQSGCCAWTMASENGLGGVRSLCNLDEGDPDVFTCCTSDNTCNDESNPQGSPAANDVKLFARDESAWLDTFVRAWRKVTANGFTTTLFDAASC